MFNLKQKDDHQTNDSKTLKTPKIVLNILTRENRDSSKYTQINLKISLKYPKGSVEEAIEYEPGSYERDETSRHRCVSQQHMVWMRLPEKQRG